MAKRTAAGCVAAEAGRLGEPSIGTMGRKLILCCACVVALLTAWGGMAAPAHAAKKRTLNKELANAPGFRAPSTSSTYDAHRATLAGVRRELKRLTGTRRTELSGAYEVVKGIAQRGDLRAARLPPVMLELQRNLEYWPAQPLLANGQRIVFEGSELVWQEVPGQGIHLHPLANFGKLNAYARNRRQVNRTTQLLDELLAVAVPRGGGLAWEYYFTFDGGRGPVDQRPLAGHRAPGHRPLRAEARPHGGAAPRHLRGPRDVREAAADGRARGHGRGRALRPVLVLAVAADRQRLRAVARRPLRRRRDHRRPGRPAAVRGGRRAGPGRDPRPTTPARGRCTRAGRSPRESDLSYHTLLRDFLANLCDRTATPEYCDAATHYTTYLEEPPVIELRTRRLRGAKAGPAALRPQQDLERDRDRHRRRTAARSCGRRSARSAAACAA